MLKPRATTYGPNLYGAGYTPPTADDTQPHQKTVVAEMTPVKTKILNQDWRGIIRRLRARGTPEVLIQVRILHARWQVLRETLIQAYLETIPVELRSEADYRLHLGLTYLF